MPTPSGRTEKIDTVNQQKVDEKAVSGPATNKPNLRESAAARTVTWNTDGTQSTV
jgi:hypothetical protein